MSGWVMTVGAKDNLLASLRAAVLDYLNRNTKAADTRKGIEEFWLDKTQTKSCPEELEIVLNLLVAEGEVAGTELLNGEILYSRVKNPGSNNEK